MPTNMHRTRLWAIHHNHLVQVDRLVWYPLVLFIWGWKQPSYEILLNLNNQWAPYIHSPRCITGVEIDSFIDLKFVNERIYHCISNNNLDDHTQLQDNPNFNLQLQLKHPVVRYVWVWQRLPTATLHLIQGNYWQINEWIIHIGIYVYIFCLRIELNYKPGYSPDDCLGLCTLSWTPIAYVT